MADGTKKDGIMGVLHRIKDTMSAPFLANKPQTEGDPDGFKHEVNKIDDTIERAENLVGKAKTGGRKFLSIGAPLSAIQFAKKKMAEFGIKEDLEIYKDANVEKHSKQLGFDFAKRCRHLGKDNLVEFEIPRFMLPGSEIRGFKNWAYEVKHNLKSESKKSYNEFNKKSSSSSSNLGFTHLELKKYGGGIVINTDRDGYKDTVTININIDKSPKEVKKQIRIALNGMGINDEKAVIAAFNRLYDEQEKAPIFKGEKNIFDEPEEAAITTQPERAIMEDMNDPELPNAISVRDWVNTLNPSANEYRSEEQIELPNEAEDNVHTEWATALGSNTNENIPIEQIELQEMPIEQIELQEMPIGSRREGVDHLQQELRGVVGKSDNVRDLAERTTELSSGLEQVKHPNEQNNPPTPNSSNPNTGRGNGV